MLKEMTQNEMTQNKKTRSNKTMNRTARVFYKTDGIKPKFHRLTLKPELDVDIFTKWHLGNAESAEKFAQIRLLNSRNPETGEEELPLMPTGSPEYVNSSIGPWAAYMPIVKVYDKHRGGFQAIATTTEETEDGKSTRGKKSPITEFMNSMVFKILEQQRIYCSKGAGAVEVPFSWFSLYSDVDWKLNGVDRPNNTYMVQCLLYGTGFETLVDEQGNPDPKYGIYLLPTSVKNTFFNDITTKMDNDEYLSLENNALRADFISWDNGVKLTLKKRSREQTSDFHLSPSIKPSPLTAEQKELFTDWDDMFNIMTPESQIDLLASIYDPEMLAYALPSWTDYLDLDLSFIEEVRAKIKPSRGIKHLPKCPAGTIFPISGNELQISTAKSQEEEEYNPFELYEDEEEDTDLGALAANLKAHMTSSEV